MNLGQPTVTQEKEERHDSHRDLVRAYKRCFATEDGRRVLADLEARCHWRDDPFTAGISHADLSYRCGTQAEVRYIHKMKNTVLAPLGTKPRQSKAKSGLSPGA